MVSQAEFDIPGASDLRTNKKILQIIGEWQRQFKSDLTSKWALADDKVGEDDKVYEKYSISKEKWNQDWRLVDFHYFKLCIHALLSNVLSQANV